MFNAGCIVIPEYPLVENVIGDQDAPVCGLSMLRSMIAALVHVLSWLQQYDIRLVLCIFDDLWLLDVYFFVFFLLIAAIRRTVFVSESLFV